MLTTVLYSVLFLLKNSYMSIPPQKFNLGYAQCRLDYKEIQSERDIFLTYVIASATRGNEVTISVDILGDETYPIKYTLRSTNFEFGYVKYTLTNKTKFSKEDLEKLTLETSTLARQPWILWVKLATRHKRAF
eukprot:GAHX01002125.1.p1 GENE.GAHX01002125.1~~GAHX01002125.1.p1  ORF type:complete len:133 (-),score=8.04 GAHX01002125.1:621-1019(-)